MMETTISDFHTSFYIPAIQKLDFYLPQVRILGANHCGEMRRKALYGPSLHDALPIWICPEIET